MNHPTRTRTTRVAKSRYTRALSMEGLEPRVLLSASAAKPAPASLVFATEPASNAAGASLPSAVVVDVKDASGNLLTTGHESITLDLFSGPTGGKIVGILHATTIDGVATFHDLSFTKAGTYTLQASEGKNLTVDSTSFTVTAPSIATSLAFVQQPTTTVAGAKISPAVAVEVKDQYGHVMTNDHSTIKLALDNSASAHPRTIAAVVKDGIATFSDISTTLAGNYTLSATDGALKTTSSNFSVTAAAGTHLAFETLPAKGTSHTTASTLKVEVLDKYNNVVTTNTSSITVTFASAPKGATAQTRTVSALNGVATFTTVSFSTAGKYVLSATDTGFPTIKSSAVVLA